MKITPTVNHENYTPLICRYYVKFIWNIKKWEDADESQTS